MEHELLKPKQIFCGRYRIERFLAQGGMGAVFVAEHVTTEQRVAVKVLWPQVLATKDAVQRFELEAKVAGRVESDHIVRVIDAGFDAATNMPFLVMELLTGHTLENIVGSDGPLPAPIVCEYMRQVASGLDKAHAYVDKDGVARPIVHRDLKPANIFLTRRDSGEPLLKVLDFGIAKVVSERTNVSQDVRGTPLFMAFEQAGGGRITPRTDVWAFGLITFWMLSGKFYWRSAQPESDAGITQLFGEVLTVPIDSPTLRLAEFGMRAPWGPAFDDWFARCVNRDPDQRFPSAGAAAWALYQALSVPIDERLSAMGATPWPKSQVTPRVASAASAPSIASGTGVAMSHSRSRPTRPHGVLWKVLVVTAGLALIGGAAGVGFFRSRLAQVRSPEPEPKAGATLVQPAPDPTMTAPPAPALPTTFEPAASAVPPAPVVPPNVVTAASAHPLPPRTTPRPKPVHEIASVPSPPPPPPPPRHTADPYGER
jgi:serine/threonine-protein kinase